MAPEQSFLQRTCIGQVPVEFCRMTKEKLQARTKKALAEMARKQGIAGWHAMSKGELVQALTARFRRHHNGKAAKPIKKRPHFQMQAAARDTSLSSSAEEQVESSKYEIGIATKDLSARVPKD